MIKKLPGFIRDEPLVVADEKGQIHCITIAVRESEAALKLAKVNVQAEYRRQGFNLAAMLEQLDSRMERGQFRNLED
ncbi:hypothetical protein [Mucilaginibacter endophyticus]|uniref:hypothetical protein n=1 Tax=Mucilaginibacter endophyticus TaxID=2675003 RepID=UPI0012B1622A|nr:hypothetical protein [Mucilaginibacter endophyticus]